MGEHLTDEEIEGLLAGSTPGPWVATPEVWALIEAESGGAVGSVQPHGNVRTVEATGERWSHADARLMAAAPDLARAALDARRERDEARSDLRGQRGAPVLLAEHYGGPFSYHPTRDAARSRVAALEAGSPQAWPEWTIYEADDEGRLRPVACWEDEHNG